MKHRLALWLAAASLFLPFPTLQAEPAEYLLHLKLRVPRQKNPLYGWRGRRETPSHVKPPANLCPADPGFESLKKWYIGWNEIENDQRTTDQSDFPPNVLKQPSEQRKHNILSLPLRTPQGLLH